MTVHKVSRVSAMSRTRPKSISHFLPGATKSSSLDCSFSAIAWNFNAKLCTLFSHHTHTQKCYKHLIIKCLKIINIAAKAELCLRHVHGRLLRRYTHCLQDEISMLRRYEWVNWVCPTKLANITWSFLVYSQWCGSTELKISVCILNSLLQSP